MGKALSCRRRSQAALTKTGPKPVPKAKPKAKAKQRDAPLIDISATLEIEDEPARKKELIRRDSLDAADRALKSKHSHVSPERLGAIVDKDGISPVEAVREEMKGLKPTEQYVETHVWIQLQQRYDLEGVTVFDGLEEPRLPQAVNAELWDCLQQARNSNPPCQVAFALHQILAIQRGPQ